MKYLVLVIMVLLAGCERTTEEKTGDFYLPEELRDCKIYRLKAGGLENLTIVRCQNSSTSTKYSCGKSTCGATVIDL